MTLIEIVVAAALAAIAITMIYTFLSKGSKIWQEGQKKIEAQQSALLSLNFLIRELELTSNESVTIYPDPSQGLYLTKNGTNTEFTGISFLSSKGKDGTLIYNQMTGEPVWQKFEIIYLDNQNTLKVAKPVELSSGTATPFLLQSVPSDINLLLNGKATPFEVNPENDKIIAKDIAAFFAGLKAGDTEEYFKLKRIKKRHAMSVYNSSINGPIFASYLNIGADWLEMQKIAYSEGNFPSTINGLVLVNGNLLVHPRSRLTLNGVLANLSSNNSIITNVDLTYKQEYAKPLNAYGKAELVFWRELP